MPVRRKTATKPDEGCDIAVLGSTATSAAAAAMMAAAGHRVVWLPANQSAERGIQSWLSVAAEPILKSLGISWKQVSTSPLSSVVFHDADLRKHQQVRWSAPVAGFVDVTMWNDQLAEAAERNRVVRLQPGSIVSMAVRDDHIALAGREDLLHQPKVLVISDGLNTETVSHLALNIPPHREGVAEQFVRPVGGDSLLEKGTVHLVLGLDGGHGLAMAWSGGGRDVLTIMSERPDTAHATTDRLLKHFFKSKVQERSWVRLAMPRGNALDFETHIGRRSLLIGEAGGFASALTGEFLYPSLRSARIAADVIAQVLNDRQPQDSLREYDAAWRMQLGDCLRPPNVDLHYLLPLVFSAKPMAERLAAAFFRGEMI